MNIERLNAYWPFVPFVVDLYRDRACQKSAAALTYMTLFAIVPMMTVTYSMFSVIPAFQGLGDQLQNLVFENFVPDTGHEVQQYLVGFSSQARNLTIVGVAMLVITAYLMLKNIEKTFNSIWGVSEARKGLANFLLYWAILSLGPMLLGIGLAMSTYLISLKLMVDEFDSLGITTYFFNYFPWVLTSAAFTLLFAAVPNCRVPIKHAAIGGVLTAFLFELVKDLFSAIVAHTSIEVIYGAFAMVPLFLLWINLLWIIILGGAILVRALSSYQAHTGGKNYPELIAVMLVMAQFKQQSALGAQVKDAGILKVGVGSEQWGRIRQALIQHRIIAITSSGNYVLCRDLETLTIGDLAYILGLENQVPNRGLEYLQTLPWYMNIKHRLQSIDQYRGEQLNISLKDALSNEKASLSAVPP